LRQAGERTNKVKVIFTIEEGLGKFQKLFVNIREELAEHFATLGSAPWQDDYARNHLASNFPFCVPNALFTFPE
jgi:hypothetical protein